MNGEHVGYVVGHLVQAQALDGHLVVAGFQLGDGQDVVDEAREALGFQHDDAQELVGHLGIVDGAVLQRLHEAADGRQRRLELMGDVGHEVGAHLLQAADLGDVLHHGQRADHLAVVAHGRYVQPQRTMPAAHRRARSDLVGVNAALAHGLVEHVVQAHVLGGLAHEAALGIPDDAQQLLGHGCDQDHLQIAIHGDDAVLHLVHDHAQRMVAAGLPQHAILDAADDGVEHLHILILAHALDATVKLALREGVQRGRDLGQQLFLAMQRPQNRQQIHRQGQQQHREGHDEFAAEENGSPCCPDSGKKQKSAILELIDGVDSFFALGILPGIHLHGSGARDLKILLRQGKHASVGCMRNTPVGVVEAEGNVLVVVCQRSQRVDAILCGFVLQRCATGLTGQANSILKILILFFRQNRAALYQ